jgi:hypothetical protein
LPKDAGIGKCFLYKSAKTAQFIADDLSRERNVIRLYWYRSIAKKIQSRGKFPASGERRVGKKVRATRATSATTTVTH